MRSNISEIPDDFFSRSKLTALNLRNSHLSLIGVCAFCGNIESTLVTLDLSGNSLYEFPTKSLVKLQSLRWLSLRNNHITALNFESDAENIGWPLYANLANLFLSGNHVSQIKKRTFAKFSRLQTLELNNNGIATLERDTFPPTLVSLHLNGNLLSNIPYDALADLESLQWLYLRDNRIAKLRASPELPFKSLEFLDIGENLIRSISGPIAKNVKIHNLQLDANHLYKVEPHFFDSLEDVSLNLRDNSISSLPVGVFSNLANLIELNAAHNRLVKLSAEVTQSLKSLEVLNLMRNSLEGYFNANQFPSLKRLDLRLNYKLKEEMPIGGNVTHLDYSFTKIQVDHLLPVARNLTRFSYQLLPSEMLQSRFAHNFPDLISVDLRYSSVSTININAFYHLEAVEELLLSHSRIESVADRAFNRLPALQHLDMSHNRLKKLSLNWFCQLSAFDMVPSTLDLSYNYISTVIAQDDNLEYECQNFITVLKLSHNQISDIDFSAFLTLKSTLLELDLSHNRLGDQHLKKFIDLKKISKINLSYNQIDVLPRRAMTGLFHLQELDLRFNFIKQITPSALANMPKLRFVDFSGNSISFIPQDAFTGTNIEVLRLDMNNLPALTSSSFRAINGTLTSLSLSHNGDMHALTTGEFDYLTELLHLDISNCGIKSVTPGAFRGLEILISLDMANNWLNYLEAETLQFLPFLQHLDLHNCSLKTMPTLRVPELRSLSLSINRLSTLPDEVFTTARKIQVLDISHNRFSEIPQKLWKGMTDLRTLNLAHNPVETLTEHSFVNLPLLEELDITALTNMKDIDIRTLSYNIRMKKLATSTYTGVGAFRLEDVLWKIPYLQELRVHIEVAALSYQIQWGFGHKLHSLHLTGLHWNQMASDALQGLEGLKATNKKASF
ncbi:chaoptin-like [Tropilaelaps mercedesae]|uniref:Chaoptin-like n=1 Tax=Tropilaelaps mercedesae TaxID=418985 RepID=A0A1V9Y1T4_9ACAR|nr:chaoptin-like [Tropilaelaps mercedesae]